MDAFVLALDIGTGSTRAALVDKRGVIVDIVQKPHDQITPKPGWSEQRPSDWWQGVAHCTQQLLLKHPDKTAQIQVVSVCGQMHGSVLLDSRGELASDTAILWNDKRTQTLVDEFRASNNVSELANLVNNPPTAAWPAFRLRWLAQNQPEVWEKVAAVLMPKDFINYQLTGSIATDYSEASCFYLMDQNRLDYDPRMLDLFGVSRSVLPTPVAATEVIGFVRSSASMTTGIPVGLPVVAGTSDMAATLLGSGVHTKGQASDSTGTSTLLTVVSQKPSSDLLLNNLHLANRAWGTFSIIDSGGDAMRWARLAFRDNQMDYAEMTSRAKAAPLGSNSLLFLPYLTGERNASVNNSRAQFFGLSRKHRFEDLSRSILEGVAFAAKQNLDAMKTPIEQMLASGGGAKDEFWLQIKASVYDLPIIKTKAEENGILGCAIIGFAAIGSFHSVEQAAQTMVELEKEILPSPQWRDYYQEAFELYQQLYRSSTQYYQQLDALDALAASCTQA